MGNLFSYINCFSTKSRPINISTSIIGTKIRQPEPIIYPMYLISPLHTDYPMAITYNENPPHLINCKVG